MKITRLLLIAIFISTLSSCAHIGQPRPSALTAQQYLQLASNSTSPSKEQYKLAAAQRYLQDRRIQDALNLINNINDDTLPIN